MNQDRLGVHIVPQWGIHKIPFSAPNLSCNVSSMCQMYLNMLSNKGPVTLTMDNRSSLPKRRLLFGFPPIIEGSVPKKPSRGVLQFYFLQSEHLFLFFVCCFLCLSPFLLLFFCKEPSYSIQDQQKPAEGEVLPFSSEENGIILSTIRSLVPVSSTLLIWEVLEYGPVLGVLTDEPAPHGQHCFIAKFVFR